jgi:putative ABC transport system permease protein
MFRKRSDADFLAEIEAHVELEAARLREQGVSEEDALSAARRAFGNRTRAQEQFYERNRWLWLDHVRQDLRLGVRLLAKTPGWSLVLVLTAALGIGASVAMFSVVYPTWLKPLPYGNPEKLYWINESSRNNTSSAPTSGTRDSVTYGRHLDVRESTDVFSHVAAFDLTSATWSSSDGVRQLKAAMVTEPFFATLGVQPVLGRTFRPDEEGAMPEVAILSRAFWRGAFGGDPDIIGKTIDLRYGQSTSVTIVGIMPPSFDFPNHRGRQVVDEEWIPEIWIPWPNRRPRQVARVVARARPDASPDQVAAEMDRLSQLMRTGMTAEQRAAQVEYFARPLREQLVGRSRQPLLIFGGAVGLMLLIACFNIATLLLSRATSRQKEGAVRVALGAPRRRIVQQMLTESLLIAVAGGALGLGLAQAALRAFNASSQPLALGLPRIAMDSWTAAFAASLVLVTGVVFGLAPAFSAVGFQAQDALKSETSSVSGSPGMRRLRQALVVGQLTFSLTLLIGAGLLAKTYLQIWFTDPGIDTRNVITIAWQRLPGQERQENQEMVRQLRAIPGVEHVALTSATPGTGEGGGINFEIEGRPGRREHAQYMSASTDYFELLRVPLRQGRLFTAADVGLVPHPVVVNEAFARHFFGHENPLGRRFTFLQVFPTDPPIPLVVAGVVGDIRQHELEREPEPMVYGQVESGHVVTPVIRTSVDARILIPTIRDTLARGNRNQPPPEVRTLNQRFADALSPRQFNAALIGGFALTACVLAATGVYGVLSYLVTLRTREMGIRLALGARGEEIVRLVVREGLGLGVAGAVLGVAGALALSRFLESMLLNVDPHDPAVFLVETAVLLAAVVAACLVPGYRASRADPAAILRHE